ncbi:MAG: Uma2 family endonuclease [Microscillaceae bacterium]|nr:Uma2 family endonuclease [Microscillaceae bacterium]
MNKPIDLKELGFQDEYKLVYEEGSKQVYAHTTYYEIDIDHDQLITEDDTPVDNIFSEKEQRLLIDPLHANKWTDRDFLASSNVAIYHTFKQPPVVPDMFLSFDVKAPEEWFEKKNRCYLMWVFGKAPELVVEVISNKIGGEADQKMKIYGQMGVTYYILVDPYLEIYEDRLNVFKLTSERKYERVHYPNFYMPEIQLGILLWEGLFERHQAPWARWCDKEGNMLKTGAEMTTELTESLDHERQEKEDALLMLAMEKQKAEAEKQKAQLEKERADKLAALLRELGVNPDE